MIAWVLPLLLAAHPAPSEARAAREQARLCLAEPDEPGIAACRSALQQGLGPSRAGVVSGVLATKLTGLLRFEEAAAVLQAWCGFAPGDAEPRRRVADVLLFGLGRADEAVARLAEAAALAPTDAPTFGAMGVALASARRYAEAGEAFDAASRLDPAFFETRPSALAVRDAARQQKPWP